MTPDPDEAHHTPTAADRPADEIRWSVVVAGIGVTAVGVLPPFMTAALSVQIREDLDLGVGVLGVLFGVFFAVSALASAPMGRLIQDRGWARGIVIAGFGSATALGAMAAFGRDVWSIGAVFVLGGVATAISVPAANLALAGSVPHHRLGLFFGLKHTAVPTAAMLAGLAVPGFGLTIGWRWAFVTAAVLALVVPLAALRVEVRSDDSAATPGAVRRPRTPLSLLALLATAAAFGIGAADALAAFIVGYATDVGFGDAWAGVLLAVGSVAGLLTRVLVGWLVDRRQQAGLPVLGALMASGAGGLVILAAGGRPWLVVGAVLAFAAGWGWSGLMTFVVVRVNRDSAAAATGVSHTGTFVGAAVGPALVGLIADQVSFTAAWWSTAAAMVAASTIVFVIWLTGGLDPDERSRIA